MESKVMDRYESLSEKYRLRTADEKNPTVLSGIVVFALHALSFVTAAAAVLFIEGHIIERVLIGLICITVLVAVEWSKSHYSDEYFTAKYFSEDLANGVNEKNAAYADSKVSFKLLVVFWVLSLSSTIISTVYVASKKAYVPMRYDINIEDRMVSAQNTLKTFTGRVKLDEQGKNQRAYDSAFKLWQKHKDEIDSQNSGNQLLYGFIGLLIAALVEIGIYYARQWHEKMQYEVFASLRKKRVAHRSEGDTTRHLPTPLFRKSV
jgi:hypothetical protein